MPDGSRRWMLLISGYDVLYTKKKREKSAINCVGFGLGIWRCQFFGCLDYGRDKQIFSAM